MGEPHAEIVIVRRRASSEEEHHHGGAWKIALADFMTALMAFFLVLWIISATDKNTKTLIARYFNPVKVEEPAKAQKGIHGAPEQNSNAPGEQSGAPKTERQQADLVEAPGGSAREASSSTPANDPKQKHEAKSEPATPRDPAKPNPTMSEEELFSDPRASLDKIAGAPPPGPRIDPSAALKGFGEVGPSADEALRDPFRPLGSDSAVNVAPANAGESPAPSAGEQPQTKTDPAAPEGQTVRPRKEPPQGLSEKTPDAASPGRPTSESSRPPDAKPVVLDAKPATDELEARGQQAARLLKDLKMRLGPEAQSVPGPSLEVQATDEGILISLTDRQSFSMFAMGSAEPQRRVLRMMDAIAMSLETMPGEIVVRGHTDAHPYRSATYDNWRLSSARAQMAYYMLNRAGLPEKRFERIEGFADHRLKDPAHPLAAENRRIEILLREAKP
jgi:chemotaxis protein MotB